MKVIASIEDPRTIEKILLHLKKKGEYSSQPRIALFTEVLGPPDLFLLMKDLSSSVEHEQQDSMDGLCKHGIRSAWFWDWWKNKKIVQVFR